MAIMAPTDPMMAKASVFSRHGTLAYSAASDRARKAATRQHGKQNRFVERSASMGLPQWSHSRPARASAHFLLTSMTRRAFLWRRSHRSEQQPRERLPWLMTRYSRLQLTESQ